MLSSSDGCTSALYVLALASEKLAMQVYKADTHVQLYMHNTSGINYHVVIAMMVFNGQLFLLSIRKGIR